MTAVNNDLPNCRKDLKVTFDDPLSYAFFILGYMSGYHSLAENSAIQQLGSWVQTLILHHHQRQQRVERHGGEQHDQGGLGRMAS